MQKWLDQGYGSMLLKNEAARQLIHNAIQYFDGDRYHLDTFVVAANHVHVLVAPGEDHTLSDILHSWKSYTAKELLKLPVSQQLKSAPTVWQKESWDHIVRSEASLDKFREYIRSHREFEKVAEKVAEASRLRSPKELQRDAAATLANEATKPLAANPAFRDLLEKKRRNHEVTIDHLSSDEILSTGYDEQKARGLIQNWQQFLEDNQDEITALQILYNRPHSKKHLVYEELKALAQAVGKPPYHIAPDEVWKAYEHLEKRPVSRDPVKILTNLISLVRHTVDPTTSPLAPFPDLVEERFQEWLSEQQSGCGVPPQLSAQQATQETTDPERNSGATPQPRFNEAQVHWLGVIKNYIALNGAFATDEQSDYLEAWQSVDSNEGMPLAVAKRAFGEDPKAVIEELNKALIA
jgi:type I restriction enzyme R subunit